MSSITPAKRPFNWGGKESNGKRFRKGPGGDSFKQIKATSSGAAVFRVLFPVSKIGGLIGKGGSVISQIRQETGAKIRVNDAVPGSDERVVFIMAADKEVSDKGAVEKKADDKGAADKEAADKETSDKEAADASEEQNKADEEVTNATVEQDVAKVPGDENVEEVPGDEQECAATEVPGDENVEEQESAAMEPEKEGSAVQKALLMVLEKMIVREENENGEKNESDEPSSVTFRLLVLSSQVGYLLGKGGCTVKQMAANSGAHIRVLPRDDLPTCASSSDDLVQITGTPDAVKKAVKSVSVQIMENATHEPDPGSSSASFLTWNVFPPFGAGSRNGADHNSRLPQFHKFRDNFPNRMNLSPHLFSYRLLCSDERVGGIIGKVGAVIRSLQHDTGCEIKVLDGLADVEDRIVIVSGPVHPDERISPLQEAVLLVQARIARALPDMHERGSLARFIVSSNQIGCLIGKGGAIIGEMRKATGAFVRVLGKDQIPKILSDNEEVIQVNGEFQAVQDAVLQITARLRHHFFRDVFPSMNIPRDPFIPDAQLTPFGGRPEFSPPRMFQDLGPPFHQFDPVGGPSPRGGFYPNDMRPSFMHDIHGPGFPRGSERPWGPQGMVEGARFGPPDFPGGPLRRNAGFPGGSQEAIITNTTVEVIVPSAVIPAIYGEGGGCLKQIRQISDAKITIKDPKPGAAETIVIISGLPDQTNAAQSLIQAFVEVCDQVDKLKAQQAEVLCANMGRNAIHGDTVLLERGGVIAFGRSWTLCRVGTHPCKRCRRRPKLAME
ncbi:KH domain-containing protein [Drosera capensis]